MKRILLFTMMCLFGLFSLNAQDLDGKSYKIKVFENTMNIDGMFSAVSGEEGGIVIARIGDACFCIGIEVAFDTTHFRTCRAIVDRLHRLHRTDERGKIKSKCIHK